jgi:hypothetical protein
MATYDSDKSSSSGLAIPVTSMLYRSSAFVFYFRMMSVVASVRGARFVKVTLTDLMSVFPGFTAARELVLKTNVFRFLVSTRGVRLAGSMFKPLSNQSLHGSGPQRHFRFSSLLRPPVTLMLVALRRTAARQT